MDALLHDLRTASVGLLLGMTALGCAPKHSTLYSWPNARLMPSELQAAVDATGDQRRLLFEDLVKNYFRDPEVRLTAAYELEQIGSRESLGPLLDALRDHDLFVRSAARHAVMHLGHPAIEALLARVKGNDSAVNRMSDATALVAMMTVETERSWSKDFTESVLAETAFVRCLADFCVQRVGVPTYPAIAISALVSGKVLVEFVLKDGEPSDLTTIGPPILTGGAVEVVKQFRFLPQNSVTRYRMTVAFEQDRNAGYEFVLPNYIRVIGVPPIVGG